MDATGTAGLPRIETTPAGPGGSAPIADALKGIGWFSLGLVALAAEGTGWLVKAATEKGKQVAPSVAKPLRTAGNTVEEAFNEAGTRLKGVGKAVGRGAEAVEHAMDERIAAVAERVSAPVRAEIGELKARIDELSKRIENLQTNSSRHDDSSD
jgi:hypothetical protein